MNIRGDITSDNAVSTFLAVAGIVLLILAVGAVGYRLLALGETQSEENAKNTATMIQAKSGRLEIGDTTDVLLREIQGEWYLMSWSKTDDTRPNKCYFNSCICICEKTTSESCQGAKGFCRKIDAKEVQVKGQTVASEGTQPGGALPAYVASKSPTFITTNYISLGSKNVELGLIDINITKADNKLVIERIQ